MREPVSASRSRLARYAGLVGSALLAVGGYLGGAFPHWPAGVTPSSIWNGEHGPWIILTWLSGTVLMVGAWWSLRRGVPSLRWAYVTVALWLVPLLVTPPMGSRDVYSYACQGAAYVDGFDPYSVGVAEAGCPWLDSVSPVWRHTAAPYGPVFVLLAALAVVLGGTLAGAIVVLRLIALLGVVLAAACLPALARRCGTPPERALWLALACPLVGVHLIAGAHNDALMLGLLAAGLLVVVRRPGRWVPLVAAGALLGLAVAVKITAVVVLPFAMLAAIAGGYDWRRLIVDGGRVAGGAVAGVLAVSAAAGLGFGWVPALANSGESRQWTAPPTAVGFVIEYVGRSFGVRPPGVTTARLVALAVLAVLLVLLWWRVWGDLRRRGADRDGSAVRAVVYGAGLALGLTVALAPVFHPWYATWPLAVLALAAVRTTWFVVPCALASFLTLPDGTNLARYSKGPGAVAMTVLVVVVSVWAVRHRTTLGRPAVEVGEDPGARTGVSGGRRRSGTGW